MSEDNQEQLLVDEGQEQDVLPPSSRVKKILKWNREKQVFDMEQQHIDELRQFHITNAQQWDEFERLYTSLAPEDHPSQRSPSVAVAVVLWTVFSIVLLLLLYVFFIILQLALFNLIMLVVMTVSWWRICKIFNAIIQRILGNGRKKPYKNFIQQLKNLEWLKKLQVEIQEHEEGKWIEIHLSESVEDNDKEEDEDLQR